MRQKQPRESSHILLGHTPRALKRLRNRKLKPRFGDTFRFSYLGDKTNYLSHHYCLFSVCVSRKKTIALCQMRTQTLDTEVLINGLTATADAHPACRHWVFGLNIPV